MSEALVEGHLDDWMAILKAATGGVELEAKAKETEVGCLVMTCQAMNLHSLQCAKLQSLLGMYAWSTGTLKQTIEVLDSAALSVLSPMIMKMIKMVADQGVTITAKLSHGPHMLNYYDNIDISTSKHVEQTKMAMKEKSTQGNLLNQDDFYIMQMKRDPLDPELSKYAIVMIDDQLTNAQIQGCVVSRRGDLNPWLQCEVFAIGLTLFHKVMNYIWALGIKHYGSAHIPGSLAYFFQIMDKKHLANNKPNFHALSSTLFQILDGILISGWIRECRYSSLEKFAESQPGPEKL
ncbi:hypothetical protein BDP27DRAFT_1422650 [Rhodocollybia butyracea]|uniref:DUF6589 domain-containing protein n=1 Tax=Rhodocollybia butyracea TaxID=206335 RepID=A0A9P5PQP1_9AGAR|nr:hypothetical protein BDP27DRAFT_1422650 [Rhodocollybia butyracea]